MFCLMILSHAMVPSILLLQFYCYNIKQNNIKWISYLNNRIILIVIILFKYITIANKSAIYI